MDSGSTISVILPVRNEAQSLPALLESLAGQAYPHDAFEVIVADGRSTDATRDVVRGFAATSSVAITLVDNPHIRSSAGRNAGLNVARGDYILFIDGHCHIPSTHLLRDTAALFAQSQADCLCRPQPLLAPVKSASGASVAAVRASALGHGRDSFISDLAATGFVDPASSGAAYRRNVFQAIGGYDERFDACEDVEFNIRVRKSGMKAYTDPRLAVYYEPRESFGSLFKQMLRYGRGRVRLMLKHRDCISAGQLVPALLAAWIIASIVSCVVPAPAWLRIALTVPVLAYAAVIAGASLHLAWKHGSGFFFRAVPIYIAIHLGLGCGLWLEALSGIRNRLTSRSSLKRAGVTEC